VHLTEPNLAHDDAGNKGTWTMIYDEGFEVVINNQKFFTFFKYEPKVDNPSPDKNEDFTSFCDETFTGWYHTVDDTNWGCYIGKRVAGAGDVRHSSEVSPKGSSASFLEMQDGSNAIATARNLRFRSKMGDRAARDFTARSDVTMRAKNFGPKDTFAADT
jgi:hypothetical protein